MTQGEDYSVASHYSVAVALSPGSEREGDCSLEGDRGRSRGRERDRESHYSVPGDRDSGFVEYFPTRVGGCMNTETMTDKLSDFIQL